MKNTEPNLFRTHIDRRETPEFLAHYAFLKEHYKHDRFAGRDATWTAPLGWTYSEHITAGAMDSLAEHGHAWIGTYESVTGQAIRYDANFKPLNVQNPK